LGEAVEGNVGITSQEDFEADEIRVEIVATERLKPSGGFVNDQFESPETRMYSPVSQNSPEQSVAEYSMHRGQTKASPRLAVSNGYSASFPFKISLPQHLGPTFQGTRKDGRWIQRTWNLKAVIAVGGRPDVETTRDITVLASAPQAATMMPKPGREAETAQAMQTDTTPPKELITSCPKCGAPINPSQEDLVATCRYCGFSVKLAGLEETRAHSMIGNNLRAQEAVETAQKYMDKGIFRSGVAKEAQITDVKLRYLPFWTFPVTTYTQCQGIVGAGIAGEINQLGNTLGDKRASTISKFGSLLKAGASAYFESQQKNQAPRTVSQSFSSHYDWPILARKSAFADINYYDVPIAKKIPFDVGQIPSEAEFLNAEYKLEEAKLRVKAEVENKERSIASGKLDTVQFCNTNTTIGEGELVHAPVWFVHYTFKAENYMILVDGSIGKILGGGKPLFHI
jgi:hypothetical protein